MAITKFDQFDFLIDIVPRDDLKPPKRQVGNHTLNSYRANSRSLQRYWIIMFFHIKEGLGCFSIVGNLEVL